ncbi:MAG: hypothetical protein ACRDPK_18450 [Carbonactinosporaceae bacterium]
MATDLLGREMIPAEARLVEHYEGLKALLAGESGGSAGAPAEELGPTAAANVRAALAQLHQAVNSLALVHEHLTDLDA